MSEVVFRPRARADLDDIWDFTAAHWGAHQADAYIRRIVDTCTNLAQGRLSERSTAEIRPGYSSYPVLSHILFYRLHEGGRFEVVRVLHQRMDPSRHL